MRERSWTHLLATVLLVAVAAIGCHKNNPLFCEGHPTDPGCADAMLRCTSNAECAAPTAVCDVAGMVCVECVAPNQVDACSGTEPVCGIDHTCQPCSAHSQCTSNACLPTGACGDDTNVAYVDPTGTDNAACTKATPCTKVASALATDRGHVKFQGTTDEADVIVDGGRVVTFLADPGATLTRSSSAGAIVTVRGNGTSLSVHDLSISNAPNDPSGFGLVIPTASGAPTVSLTRVTVTNNPAGGISASGGSLAVTRSTIFGNQGGAIIMSADGEVSIVNNIIHHNGNPLSAAVGGLSLRPIGSSKVEFNTIVDNQANTGAASAGGVFCDVMGFVVANNIVFRNTGGASGTVQTFGNCAYGNSLRAPGSSAVDNSPGFVNPNMLPLDYHLSASSPASVLDAAGSCEGEDFDGDARPVGGACDLGADERKP